MGLARALVDEGQVPPAEAFVVEGMFSEHDLPVNGGSCADVLCLGAAQAVAPDLDDAEHAWLQIGLSSTVDPDTYQRPDVTLIATVDVSGSMGWGRRSGSTPGEMSRALLRRIAPELGENDRFAIVTYGSSVRTALAPTGGADQSAITSAIGSLHEGGSTNMEAGLSRAFSLAESELGRGNEVRVLLFTDERPNVGATDASQFQRMVDDGAQQGVGLTIFGMGEGLGQELFDAMSQLRGGNAFSVMQLDDVDTLMSDSWPYMLSPIAYDMHVSLTPGDATLLSGAYGFPGAGTDGSAKLDVASVFLSRRRGALLVRLGRDGDLPAAGATANLTLSYARPDGTTVDSSLALDWSSLAPDTAAPDATAAYSQPETGRTVSLALLVTGLHDAADAYGTDPTAAVARAQQAVDRLQSDAEALDDDELRAETPFAQNVLRLMQEGAPQGTLYGY